MQDKNLVLMKFLDTKFYGGLVTLVSSLISPLLTW